MGKIADLSKWQGDIDFKKAASELSLAILRVQDGSYLDPKLDDYIRGCKANDIPFGVYGFFRASTYAGGAHEAEQMILRTKDAGGGALFYVIDCETDEPNAKSIRGAIDYFKKKKLKCGIYFAHHKYPQYGGNYGQDFTWIPRYSRPGKAPQPPKYPCDLWQYTSSGDLRGVEGNVDLNLIRGKKTLKWFTGVKTPPKDIGAIKPKPPKTDHIHIVKKGDTLSEIAIKHKTTWQKLAKHNHLDHPDVIHVGQKIAIPT